MTIIKQDSNSTSLAIAEEASLGTLGGSPVWYGREPNTYPDFGGDVQSTARSPINPSRQEQKGSVTDLNVTGGWNEDFTQTNMQRLMQGLFFADAHVKPCTSPIVGNALTITGVTGSTKTYTISSGGAAFLAGHLAYFTGFSNSANNGLDKLAAGTGTTIVRTTGTTDEVSPPAAAKIEVVGFEFASGDIVASVANGLQRLTSSAVNMTTLGLNVGEWVFIGGDSAGQQLTNGVQGYARIKTITTTYIDFDDTTFAAAAAPGTGKTVRLFFGTFIRNENDPTLIKRRTYQIERQLGNDSDGMQSEYLTGAVFNQMKLNIPISNKLNMDASFVAIDNEQRTGLQGIKSGTRVAALGESAVNTSSDIYRNKMYVLDSTTSNPSSLFGYITGGDLTITNGATPLKVVGTFGAIEVNIANFKVSGNLSALFTTVAAVQAVRNNADVCYNMIVAKGNAGFVFDIPRLTLGGGKLQVQKDKEIALPLSQMASQNTANYTAAMTYFNYLPTVAM
jgi:hypothetical protein